MSQREMWPDTPSAIGSLESADGHSPCDSLAGQTTDPCGPVAVPASHSQPPENVLVLQTHGIFGPRGGASSASAALQSSLASRLQDVMASLGSTLYRLTWREAVTPLGRPICQLRALARRTADNACGSWPTPNAGPQNDNDSTFEARREAMKAKHGNGNGFGLNLGQAVQLSTWATPNASDWKGPNLSGSDSQSAQSLSTQAHGTGSPAETESRGQLNPGFARWLMGYPAVWLYLAPISVTPSTSRRRTNGSSAEQAR